jgi:uncharacterized damage-inducible protein DinB
MAVPEVERIDPDPLLGERDMLAAWVDFHRATLLRKCAGLSEEQLKQRSCPPSSMSLLGLVRHLTEVENGWFAANLTDEGYARHDGHADLLRERVDGAVGE